MKHAFLRFDPGTGVLLSSPGTLLSARNQTTVPLHVAGSRRKDLGPGAAVDEESFLGQDRCPAYQINPTRQLFFQEAVLDLPSSPPCVAIPGAGLGYADPPCPVMAQVCSNPSGSFQSPGTFREDLLQALAMTAASRERGGGFSGGLSCPLSIALSSRRSPCHAIGSLSLLCVRRNGTGPARLPGADQPDLSPGLYSRIRTLFSSVYSSSAR